MSNIVIVTNPAERDEYENVIDRHAEYKDGKMTWEVFSRLPRKIWLDVCDNEHTGETYFRVIDNREGECLVDEFATLDGAILYATDLKWSYDDQAEWDYPGSVKDGGDLTARKAD